MKIAINRVLLGLVLFATIGCVQPSLKPEVVTRANTQQMSEILYGEIINVKAVTIQADPKQGKTIGGAVGAVAGSMVGDDDERLEKKEVLGALVGGVLGATVSSVIADKANSREGVQLTIKTQDNRTISLTQEAGRHSFQIGDKVEIITMGGRSQVAPIAQ